MPASSLKKAKLSLIAALLACVLGTVGCGEAPASSYQQRVLQDRLQKDMALRSGDQPVLNAATREHFQGLRYFPVDTTYRFEVPLHRLPTPDTVQLAQRTGAPDTQLKIGTVEVPLPEGAHQLSVFRPTRGDGTKLWIPFSDETTGTQTYGAGRYLDLPLEEDGTVLVDFNRAYNPLCDYNPQKYNCAIAPPGNHLPVAVRAGEKKSLLHGS